MPKAIQFSSFTKLPGELQLRIFSYLPSSSLFEMKRLSKRYNELIRTSGFQSNMILKQADLAEDNKNLESLLIDYIKLATECPLDYTYAYLCLRPYWDNAVIIHSKIQSHKDTIEGLNRRMNIYIKCKAVSPDIHFEGCQTTINNDDKKNSDDLYSNVEMKRLLNNIKLAKKLVVRIKEEDEEPNMELNEYGIPMQTSNPISVEHIPGPIVETLFEVQPLYNSSSNHSQSTTSSLLKTILLDPIKAYKILNGYLEAGLVLEFYYLNSPIIETYEYIENTSENNTKTYKIKRCIRLDPLKQMDYFKLPNVENIELNKNVICSMAKYIKELFSYFNI